MLVEKYLVVVTQNDSVSNIKLLTEEEISFVILKGMKIFNITESLNIAPEIVEK